MIIIDLLSFDISDILNQMIGNPKTDMLFRYKADTVKRCYKKNGLLSEPTIVSKDITITLDRCKGLCNSLCIPFSIREFIQDSEKKGIYIYKTIDIFIEISNECVKGETSSQIVLNICKLQDSAINKNATVIASRLQGQKIIYDVTNAFLQKKEITNIFGVEALSYRIDIFKDLIGIMGDGEHWSNTFFYSKYNLKPIHDEQLKIDLFVSILNVMKERLKDEYGNNIYGKRRYNDNTYFEIICFKKTDLDTYSVKKLKDWY